jgi:hypothetical protein
MTKPNSIADRRFCDATDSEIQDAFKILFAEDIAKWNFLTENGWTELSEPLRENHQHPTSCTFRTWKREEGDMGACDIPVTAFLSLVANPVFFGMDNGETLSKYCKLIDFGDELHPVTGGSTTRDAVLTIVRSEPTETLEVDNIVVFYDRQLKFSINFQNLRKQEMTQESTDIKLAFEKIYLEACGSFQMMF